MIHLLKTNGKEYRKFLANIIYTTCTLTPCYTCSYIYRNISPEVVFISYPHDFM